MADILFVDDHEAVTGWLEDILSRLGHQIDVVSHPSKLSALGNRGWSIAFVDMLFEGMEVVPGLPRQTGLDTLAWVNQNSPTTRLVLFTTPGDSRSILITQAFKEFPIQGAVSKTHRGGLEKCLSAVLRGHRYIDPALQGYEEALETAAPLRKMLEDPGYRYIVMALIGGARSWDEVAERLKVKVDDLANDRRAMESFVFEAGLWDGPRSMKKEDWIEFLRVNRDFLEGEAQRIERLQQALPKGPREKVFRKHLARQKKKLRMG